MRFKKKKTDIHKFNQLRTPKHYDTGGKRYPAPHFGKIYRDGEFPETDLGTPGRRVKNKIVIKHHKRK